jgi:two-component system invasion response regulator UvrY
MQMGAHGYLTKSAGSNEMVHAIKAVKSGQRYIAPEIAQQIALAQFSGRTDKNPFKSLSDRELQIMLMITKGEKVQNIAEQLNLTSKTVNSYRYRMFEKLNIGGDVELTHLAIRHKMIDIDSEGF